ncbi:Ff.00g116030.m01.CDS01 [Fusarium sp. VM40]|nr:Ff.00g116030.m01.CDS01 [Fusarium sp. VM40]
MITLTYQSLTDFSGLPALREAVTGGHPGLLINNVPQLPSGIYVDAKHNIKLHKKDVSSPDQAMELMRTLHHYSQAIYNNLSHALELPWEKYLSEMHEFAAPSSDVLQTVDAEDRIPNEWSTLTLILSSSHPGTALVLFGTALSVFSEGLTPELGHESIDTQLLAGLSTQVGGKTAGAPMSPLSTSEYESRKRVKESLLYRICLK